MLSVGELYLTVWSPVEGAPRKYQYIERVKINITEEGSYQVSNNHSQVNFYRPQRSWGKVMFLQASVILSTGGGVCVPQCMLGYQPPRSRPPTGADPPPPRSRACRGRHASYWNANFFFLFQVHGELPFFSCASAKAECDLLNRSCVFLCVEWPYIPNPLQKCH